MDGQKKMKAEGDDFAVSESKHGKAELLSETRLSLTAKEKFCLRTSEIEVVKDETVVQRSFDLWQSMTSILSDVRDG